MKKVLMIFLVLAFVGIFAGITLDNAEAGNCATVRDRTIPYSTGHYLHGLQPIKPGFDPYGYNYQAHMFNGYYTNSYLGGAGFAPYYAGDDAAYLAENPGADSHWAWPYRDVALSMKWSDTWLSNKDCNGDDKLDRGYSCDPVLANGSACPGAWLTNHQSGTYEQDGKEIHWTYFVKIVAPPADATVVDGIWCAADGTEIGPVIWGGFAIIQQVENDAGLGVHGAQYLSPAGPGFGHLR